MYDVAIIGCGVSGASAAMELSRYSLTTIILEKENDVCNGTSKANSAIIHAGYDPAVNTLMAKLNVAGCKMASTLCEQLDVPYKQVGSLVLAFTETEVEELYRLESRGSANGVPDLKIISYTQVKELEPNISDDVKAALYAPTAGIVDPWELGTAMAEVAVKNGAEIRLNAGVTEIKKIKNGWQITTEKGQIQTRCILNAAGVYSDAVHNMAAKAAFKINPCKGEYYLLDKTEGSRINHIIFQCPNKDGKGILVTPTVHGNLLIGPTAEKTGDTEDISVTASGLSLIKEKALKSVPSIQFGENIRNFAGIRANSTVPDFIIQESAPGFIDIAGMRSPGLASAPAIGPYVARLLQDAGLELNKKAQWDGTRNVIRFKSLPPEEKNRLIQQKPAYGRVICRCETITEGEILDALHSIIPPCSIDGIKRRTGAGMGRCQGGFCGPRVLELIAREKGIVPQKVPNDKNGSYILTEETKQGGKNHA